MPRKTTTSKTSKTSKPRKTPGTVTTNPTASRLPSQRGTFSPNPPTPDPVTPKVTRSRQITSGPRVEITGREVS